MSGAAGFFAAIPYAGFLGLRAEETGGGLCGVMPFAEHLIGNPTIPALHGGAIGAFLELTATAELAGRCNGRLPRTIGVTVDYLRSGRGLDTYARAEVKRMGRRIANVVVGGVAGRPRQAHRPALRPLPPGAGRGPGSGSVRRGGKTVAKTDLPSKPCAACGLPFSWRKKWTRDWDQVRFCSDRCRAAGAKPEAAASR